MEAVIDSVGRIVIPKKMRDALGLAPGSRVDISIYGGGAHIVPGGRTARIEESPDGLVARGTHEIDDSVMFGLIDSGRR